MAMVL